MIALRACRDTLAALLATVRPTALLAWTKNRGFDVPGKDAAANATRAQRQITLADHELAGLDADGRELVLLSIGQERERIAALEGKGLAVTALPSVMVAIAAFILDHGTVATTTAVIALAYCGSALLAASQVLRPRPREVFGIDDATSHNGLARAVAATRINQQIGLIINNWVVAAINDSVRAAVVVVVGALAILVGTPTHSRATQPAPARSSRSTPTGSETHSP